MAVKLLRSALLLGALGLAWLGPVASFQACPFCSATQGPTLTNEVGQASMVLYGTLGHATPGNSSTGPNDGTTVMTIDAVIKPHEVLAGRKEITLNRYVLVTDDKDSRYLVFCDVFKGKIDPYRGMPVRKDANIVAYLKGATEIKDQDIGTRLRFFFNYLDNPETEINTDAYKEFANADYKDYRRMAKDLPPDKLAKWLEDPNTSYRSGLYAMMLGHCGHEEHAHLLRTLLDDPRKRTASGVDGMLAGYILLKPQEGWDYLKSILKDKTSDFTLRYAGLRALRFFHDSRPDVLSKAKLLEGMGPLLEQEDMADLAIEDLRKWGEWDLTDQVMAWRTRSSTSIRIIRRAMLKYALSCPHNAVAEAYVDQVRRQEPRTVKEAEEIIKLESGPQPSTSRK